MAPQAITPSANDSLSIPKDNNGNDIADGWQDDAIHDYDPWADEETGPGNNTFRGDGFTVLEEYRGFIVQGEHIRTDSRKKDLFIHSEFDEGIGYASNLPDDIITTHQILFAEMNDPIKKDAQGNDVMDAQGNPVIDVQGDPCVMNSRSCGNALQVVKQRALWVRKHENANGSYTHSNGTDYDGIYGIIEPVVGPCHQVLYVYIFHEYIKERNKAAVAEMEEHEPNKALSTTSEMIKRYIGHELGHGINLYHPWSTDRVGGALGTYLFNRPGETIMDYGNPHVVGEYSNKGYNTAASSYMSGYEGSKEYPDFHNSEYQFVAPDVRAAHLAKPLLDPPRKTKPQWELDNDEDNDNGTGTDGQGTDTAPPDAPYNLSASFGDGQVRLSWTAGGGTTTDYEYRYRVKDAATWGDWISALLSNSEVLSDTEVLILSLINGTTYEFQVKAMNGQSASAATESSESTPATVPRKPTSLSGDRYNQGVTLRWYPPDDDGGADVTGYEYRYSYTYETYSSWTSVGGTNRRVSIGGLTNGRQYQFQVRAKNSVGYGAESLTIYKMPATTPSAPQNLTKTVGDGEVSLYWAAPYSNGGLIITDYEYSYREGSSGDFGSWTSAGTDQWKRVTDLTNDTLYEFRVRARNRIGAGTSAGPIEATPATPGNYHWSDITDQYYLTVGDIFSLDRIVMD